MLKLGENTMTQRKIIHTNKNTGFEAWKVLCSEEFAKRGIEPVEVSALRMQHAWEGGDTPYGWVDFLIRQREMQARTKQMRRDNP